MGQARCRREGRAPAAGPAWAVAGRRGLPRRPSPSTVARTAASDRRLGRRVAARPRRECAAADSPRQQDGLQGKPSPAVTATWPLRPAPPYATRPASTHSPSRASAPKVENVSRLDLVAAAACMDAFRRRARRTEHRADARDRLSCTTADPVAYVWQRPIRPRPSPMRQPASYASHSARQNCR